MDRNRVVDTGTDPVSIQIIPQCVTLGQANHVLMKDVHYIRPAHGERQRQSRQSRIVSAGNRLPSPIIRSEIAELGPEDRGLNWIKARVDADPRADMARAPPVFANFTHCRGKARIARHGHAGITERTQVLSRIKAEASDVAE